MFELFQFYTRYLPTTVHISRYTHLELLHALCLDLVIELLLRQAESFAHQQLLSWRQLHHRLTINSAALCAPQKHWLHPFTYHAPEQQYSLLETPNLVCPIEAAMMQMSIVQKLLRKLALA